MRTDNILILSEDIINNAIENRVLKESKIIKNSIDGLKFLSYNVMSGRFPRLIIIDLDLAGSDPHEFISNYEKIFFKDFPRSRIICFSSRDENLLKIKSIGFKSVLAIIEQPLTIELLTRTLEKEL